MASRRYREYVGAMRGLVLAVATLALSAPAAGAQSFGTNLNRPANNTYADCYKGYAEAFYYPQQNSCTWAGVGGLTNTTENHVVPATGVIHSVRLKTGAPTGPMQFTIERYYRRDNPGDPGHPDLRGPFWQAESQVFTPPTNATTPIPVNLSVKAEFDQALGAYVFDVLALSVLSPNVPIPANDTGDRSGSYLASAFFPRIGPQDQTSGRVDRHSPSGVVPLWAATVDCGAARSRAHAAQCGGGGGGGGGGTTAGMALARSSATVLGRFARVRLVCRLTISCKGRLRLQSGAAASRKKRPKTYASGRFSIKAGATKTVKVKLTKAGRRLMRRRRSVKVTAQMVIGKGKTAQVFTGRLTLKRKRR
jgi:hypothetical protein